jgi:hypothetical protein
MQTQEYADNTANLSQIITALLSSGCLSICMVEKEISMLDIVDIHAIHVCALQVERRFV